MTCLTFGHWLFKSCSWTCCFHFGTRCSWTRVEECVISKSFTFSLLCGVDCTYCVGSCAIICMYSSLVLSLYKCFQAVSCWNLSTGRLQKTKPILNANTSPCGVWPMDFNAEIGAEKEMSRIVRLYIVKNNLKNIRRLYKCVFFLNHFSVITKNW